MIICSIPDAKIRISRKRLFKHLKKAIDNNQAFDLKQYMTDEYNMIHGLIADENSKHAVALDYARLVPHFVQQGIGVIPELFGGLAASNFNFNELGTIFNKTVDEVEGLKAVEDYLELADDTIQELADDNQNVKPPAKVTEDPITDENAETIVPETRQDFNFVGQTLSSLTPLSFMDRDLALSPTPMHDQLPGGEDKKNPNNFFFKVKRNIIGLLANASYDSSTLKFGEFNDPVYLTAKSVASIDSDDLGPDYDASFDPEQKGVYLVLTDSTGYPFRFDADGKPTIGSGGKIAYYALRNTDKIFENGEVRLNSFDEKRIQNLADISYNGNHGEAKAEYIRQLELTHDMRNYVNKDKQSNSVQSIINGGTVGFAVKDNKKDTSINQLNFDGQSFSPFFARKNEPSKGLQEGRTYFKVDGFYGQPIEVERPTVDSVSLADGTSLKDKVISLLVDDVHDEKGNALSPQKRQSLIEFFIKTASDDIQVVVNQKDPKSYALKYKGVQITIDTPENKAAAKKQLNQLFSEFTPRREVSKNSLSSKQKQNIITEATPKSQWGLNKVLEVVNEDNTKSYFIIEKPKVNVRGYDSNTRTKFLEGKINDVDLSTNAEGNVIMTPNTYDYKSFIFDNFSIRYQVHNNNLVKYDAYFTFQPTQDAMSQVYDSETSETEAENKTKDDIEKLDASELDSLGPLDNNDDVDDLLNDARSSDTRYKIFDQKGVEKQATEEQIKAAKEWYGKHPLSKIFPFEAMFNAVNLTNPDAVASWGLHGITLYKGSNYSDLYHEAFHAFTQTFLTKPEKTKLYNEVRGKSGSFRDHNGKQVSFTAASDLQIEEYLAEDFRTYMLNGKAPESTPVRNSLFTKILNLLKALFNNSSVKDITTNEHADNVLGTLYEKLRVGNLNDYNFSADNVQFGDLNKGVQAWTDDVSKQQLSYEDSQVLLDTVDSIFSSWSDLLNSGLTEKEMDNLHKLEASLNDPSVSGGNKRRIKTIIDSRYKSKKTFKYSTQIFKDPAFMKTAYKYTKRKLRMLYDDKASDYKKETDSITKARLKKDAELLAWSFNNFGDTDTLSSNQFDDGDSIKGVIGYHMAKSEQYFEEDVILDFENMSEEDTFVKGRSGYDRGGNESSMKDLAQKEILYLIKGLQVLDKEGNKKLNKLGVPELVSFQEVWNRLARTLQNTLDAEVMYEKLNAEAKNYPVFKQLLNKIGPVGSGSPGEVAVWGNFWQTFNLTRIPLIQMTLEKQLVEGQKSTYESRIGEAFNNDTKVGKNWESEFHTVTTKYVKRDKNGHYLDLKQVLLDFSIKADVPSNKRLAGRELEFLHAIGFKIADHEDVRKVLENTPDVGWFRSQIKYLYNRGVEVRNFSDITQAYEASEEMPARNDINTRFKALQVLHSRYSDQSSNFMVTNAAGNMQSEHSLNNTLTIMVNSINNSKDYWELMDTPHMAHLDINKDSAKFNPFAMASHWLNSIYVLDRSKIGSPEYGSRRKISDEPNAPYVEINFSNLSGVLLMTQGEDATMGTTSATADEVTKMILDFHLSNQIGIPELMRHADKSTSYAASIQYIQTPGGIKSKYINNSEFLQDPTAYNQSAFDMLFPHINAEFQRIKIMRETKDAQNTDFNYLKAGQNFVAFDDVLKSSTKTIILNKLDTTDDLIELNDKEINELILQDITDYFEVQVTNVTEKFNENPFQADNMHSALKVESKLQNLSLSDAKTALIKSFVYNSWIHNIESINFFYGDLALYNHAKDEFHKRNAGMGSTGTLYRTDSAIKDYINNQAKRPYSEKNGGNYKAYDGTFETAIIKDNEIGSVYHKEYLKAIGDENAANPYAEGRMNEGDAQGWVSFDSYRIMKISEGSWSDAQENLYQDIINGKRVSPRQVKQFFPVVKAQYFGPLSKEGLPLTAFHKFSLLPLIPTMIKGTNLENLHNKMMAEGVDYSLFESGSKVSTVTKDGSADPIYTEGRSELSNEPFTKNTIFMNYLKNQLEIAPKYKGQVIFSTQLRKLIEDGLMENGVPTDFLPGEKSVTKRINTWNAIGSDNAKRKASARYSLLRKYEGNITKLTGIKKRKLLKDMDWTMEIVDGEEVINGDIEDLIKFVKKELTRQDLADHEIDFLAIKNGKLKHDLSLSLSADKIEKLLNALVVKRLVKQKVNGEGLVQISGALFEQLSSTRDRNYSNPTTEELDKWGTNDLPTYHKGKDGKTKAMKVKIALQGSFMHLLDAKHNDGEEIGSRERLNEMIRDEKWMSDDANRKMVTMVGVRIPVQGLNSMEFMEVYEFLPTEAGNIIVPPAEIVAKSGSDFDIDKLTIMMPNLIRGKRGIFTSSVNLDAAYENYKQAKKDDALKIYTPKRDRTTGLMGVEESTPYDSLLTTIFGMDVSDMVDDIEEILLDEGELLTREEFGNTKAGLKIAEKSTENDLIGDIKNILELPENYVNLIRPNSTTIVQPIADELAEYVMDYDPKAVINGNPRTKNGKTIISATRTLEVEYNLFKHASNNIGKQTLGMGAVDNTYNTVFNRIGFRLNATAGMTTAEYKKLQDKIANKKRLSKAEMHAFNKYHRQKLFLPHNTMEVNGEDAISLSHDMDANNEHRVSDVINQLLNGWLDIAKDAWIFNIQGNKEVTPVLMFLIQSGVPVKDAIYFASMPMVRDYVKEQRLAKSTFAEPLEKAAANPNFFRGKARSVILKNPKYGFKISSERLKGAAMMDTINKEAIDRIDAVTEGGNFKTEDMLATIKDYSKHTKAGMEHEYSDMERAAFLHFLEAENMAMPVRDVKMKMNFDTSKSGTLFEAQNRMLMKDALKQDARFPEVMVDRILNDSPIGSFYIQPFQIGVWKDMFELRNHPMVNKYLLDKSKEGNQDDIRSTFNDSEKFNNEFRNDLISFIFQNELRQFDINTKSYRGYAVESVRSLSQGISFKPEKLDNGAYALGDVLYINQAQLKKEYNNRVFTTQEYENKGLAKVNSQAFQTADEYYNFVFERETLRKNNNYAKASSTRMFKQLGSQLAAEVRQLTDESQEAYDERLGKITYEVWLRDSALDNTFNHWKLFKSDHSYANQFELVRTLFPTLGEDFSLINQLSIGTSGAYSNLKLNDPFLDGTMLNVMHENLQALADDKIRKVDNAGDNMMISKFFKRFATVAFLQSGMNAKSAFSLTRLVPQDSFLRMMEEPTKKFVSHLSKADDSNLTPPILDVFYNDFVNLNSIQNRRSRIRGKNYNDMYTLDDSIRDMGEVKSSEPRSAFTAPIKHPAFKEGVAEKLVIPNHTINKGLQNKDGSKRLANTNGIDITINPVNDVEEFFNYFEGNETGATSEQKQTMQFELALDGYNMKRIRSIINTPEKANNFLVLHEQSHIDNKDKDVYWLQGKSLLTDDKIKIEVRATVDALEALEKESLNLITNEADVSLYRGSTFVTNKDAQAYAEEYKDSHAIVYNFATENQNNATRGDHNFYTSNLSTVIGLPTLVTYGAANYQMLDVNGDISPENKQAIDDAITSMKQAQADGLELTFNTQGYGQYMVGMNDGKHNVAKETFLYLSQRLFEEFGFINPNYLTLESGVETVQKAQPITDEMVRDFMKHC